MPFFLRIKVEERLSILWRLVTLLETSQLFSNCPERDKMYQMISKDEIPMSYEPDDKRPQNIREEWRKSRTIIELPKAGKKLRHSLMT
jgi:hypothetical protein